MAKSKSKSRSSAPVTDFSRKAYAGRVDPQHGKHKSVVAVMHALGGQFMGLDRLYMGCYMSGVFKFALFLLVLGIVLYQNSKSETTAAATVKSTLTATGLPATESQGWLSEYSNLGKIGFNTIMVLAAWAIFDTIVVFYNMVSKDYRPPFTYCRDRGKLWSSESEVHRGQMYAFLMVVLVVIIGVRLYTEIPTWLLENLKR